MAKMTNLEIETRRLQSDIESLRQRLNQMRQTGDRMMTGINALSSMWEGQAKDVFTEQFRTDYETLQSMEKVIEDMIKCLEDARKQYESCESSVSSIVNAIRV